MSRSNFVGPRLELDRVASGNSGPRHADAEQVCAQEPSAAVFRNAAAAAMFGSNATAAKLCAFYEAGVLLDARSLSILRAAGDESAGLSAFRSGQVDEHGVDWYPGREAFESLWVDGEEAVYGALNLGNAGAEPYGYYCLLSGDPEKGQREERAVSVAVFPANSARAYWSATEGVLGTEARQSATAWSDRGALLVVLLGAEACVCPQDEWPNVVCEKDRFVEVVIAPAPDLEMITAVRVPSATHDRLEELLVDCQDEERDGVQLLDASERNEARAFAALQDWRRQGLCAVEVVC